MSEQECEVIIGRVVNTVGLKGEVKVWPATDHPEQFEAVEEVLLKGDSEARRLAIERVRYHKNTAILKFAGVDDISEAERLRDYDICIRESELVPLGEDEYYIDDILGLEVVTTEGESLGKVEEVLQGPANDVYVTDRAMVPATKGIVQNIDLRKKKMVVKPVEGLLME